MSTKSTFFTLLVAALAAACSDGVGPPGATPSFAKGGKSARSADMSPAAHADTPTTTAPTPEPTSGTPAGVLTQAADAPRLMAYRVNLTAVQGEANTLVAFYDNPWSAGLDEGEWFFKLDLPRDGQFFYPDGTPLAEGESIELTAEIDTTRFLVRFGPHGSQFTGRKPALLKFNLIFAALSGLGDPDVWYQPAAGDPWIAQGATLDWKRNKVTVSLDHFSNYAIAY